MRGLKSMLYVILGVLILETVLIVYDIYLDTKEIKTIQIVPKNQAITKPLVIKTEPIPLTVKVENKIETKEEIEFETKPCRIPGISEADIELMARVVMSEASILPFEAKQAVAETIINRVLSDEFPNTVEEVVYQQNAYSTADNGKPNQDCYNAVTFQLFNQVFPKDMYWFRTDYPHAFGYYYMQIGNTYFNTETFYAN